MTPALPPRGNCFPHSTNLVTAQLCQCVSGGRGKRPDRRSPRDPQPDPRSHSPTPGHTAHRGDALGPFPFKGHLGHGRGPKATKNEERPFPLFPIAGVHGKVTHPADGWTIKHPVNGFRSGSAGSDRAIRLPLCSISAQCRTQWWV